MILPVYFVDAFTDVAFSGNPAAVCLLSKKQSLSDATMQSISAELNLTETAFVTPTDGPSFNTSSVFGLRWFTPATEVPLCGHATLASATVLFNCIGNKAKELKFDTLSGRLTAKQQCGLISLDMPKNVPETLQDTTEVLPLVTAVLGDIVPADIRYSPDMKLLLIRLPDSWTRTQLERISPPLSALPSVHKSDVIAVVDVVVTLRGCHDNGCVSARGVPYDFVSRVFSPWVGIDEDPVTGSTHTVLGPYWSKQLGKTSMFARQCSARGGDLYINVNSWSGRVHIAGSAVIVLRGTIEC